MLSFRSEVRHRLRVLPIDALDSSGFVVDPLFEAGSVEQSHNQDFAATAVTVVDESYVHPPVWSDVDLAHR